MEFHRDYFLFEYFKVMQHRNNCTNDHINICYSADHIHDDTEDAQGDHQIASDKNAEGNKKVDDDIHDEGGKIGFQRKGHREDFLK